MNLFNYSFDDFFRIRNIILFCIVLLFCMFTTQRKEHLICSGKYNVCQVKKVNLLYIPTIQNLYIASDIVGTETESYQKSRRSRHHVGKRRQTYYRLKFVNKSGNKKTVFNDFYTAERAEQVGKEIMSCLKAEAFPCEFKRK